MIVFCFVRLEFGLWDYSYKIDMNARSHTEMNVRTIPAGLKHQILFSTYQYHTIFVGCHKLQCIQSSRKVVHSGQDFCVCRVDKWCCHTGGTHGSKSQAWSKRIAFLTTAKCLVHCHASKETKLWTLCPISASSDLTSVGSARIWDDCGPLLFSCVSHH